MNKVRETAQETVSLGEDSSKTRSSAMYVISRIGDVLVGTAHGSKKKV